MARGTLRAILGRYLGAAPADPRSAYGPHGKPALAPAHDIDLSFNLSPAGDITLYDVCEVEMSTSTSHTSCRTRLT